MRERIVQLFTVWTRGQQQLRSETVHDTSFGWQELSKTDDVLLFLEVFNLICKSTDAFCFLFTFYFTLYTLHLPSHFLFFWLIRGLSYQVAGQWKSSHWVGRKCVLSLFWFWLWEVWATSSDLPNPGDVTVGQSQQLILSQLLHLQNDSKDMYLCQVQGEERTAL